MLSQFRGLLALNGVEILWSTNYKQWPETLVLGLMFWSKICQLKEQLTLQVESVRNGCLYRAYFSLEFTCAPKMYWHTAKRWNSNKKRASPNTMILNISMRVCLCVCVYHHMLASSHRTLGVRIKFRLGFVTFYLSRWYNMTSRSWIFVFQSCFFPGGVETMASMDLMSWRIHLNPKLSASFGCDLNKSSWWSNVIFDGRCLFRSPDSIQYPALQLWEIWVLDQGTQMACAMRKGASSAFGARANGKKLAQARLLVCRQSLGILGVGARCPNHYHYPLVN